MKEQSVGDVGRDSGIARVLDNESPDWKRGYANHAVTFLRRNRFVTGEEIRLYCEPRIKAPRHPNSWGAAFNSLVTEKWLRQTNEMEKSSIGSSHSRMARIWRSLIFVAPNAPDAQVYKL